MRSKLAPCTDIALILRGFRFLFRKQNKNSVSVGASLLYQNPAYESSSFVLYLEQNRPGASPILPIEKSRIPEGYQYQTQTGLPGGINQGDYDQKSRRQNK